MTTNKLPTLNFKDNPTGCCPRFDPKPWDEKTFEFKDKLFMKAKTFNFMHIPLTMGPMMKKAWKAITDAKAYNEKGFVVLSYDCSPWKGEHYFTVTKEVPGYENVKLSGTYLTKVFEGPFQDAGKWVKGMEKYVEKKGKKIKKIYLYYTTCPKCAKKYGKNYVVILAQI